MIKYTFFVVYRGQWVKKNIVCNCGNKHTAGKLLMEQNPEFKGIDFGLSYSEYV